MEQIINNKIIIWGIDNFNTLGLFRQLGPAGCDIFFLIHEGKGNCASCSKWCKDYAEVKTIEEGADYLFNHFSNLNPNPIIITPGDGIIEYIDQHREDFQKHFIVPGTSEGGLLTKIDNKNEMTSLAKKLGFNVPESRTCRWNDELQDISYPCIIKPSHITNGKRSEFKFKICENEKELKKTLNWVRHESEFILQQFIPKESVALVYGARMSGGEVKTAGVLVKDRFISCGDGSHGFVSSIFPKGIEIDKIEAFLNEIDYYGLFSFEYGLYDGQAFFFEVNLRNDGTSHYFYQAGANIPLAWVRSMAGEDYSQVSTSVTEDKWFIDEISDLENVYRGFISREQWEKERAEAAVFKYFDDSDMMPYEKQMGGVKLECSKTSSSADIDRTLSGCSTNWESTNKIIIWGRDNYNTLGLLRQLSGGGRYIFFLMIGKPAGCASESKWFGDYATTHSIEEGFDYLLSQFENERLKPVIFTPSDEVIEFVDQHKDELEKRFIIPGTQERGLLTQIDNKNEMADMARRLGFLVPKSQICCKTTVLADISYPCIIKPAHTTAGHRNEFKFKICKNQKELAGALKYVREESEFILQQYIPKESDALVYGCRMKDGTVKIAGTIIRDRFCRTGETSHGLVTAELPNHIERNSIEKFLNEIDYCGLFSFEYGLYDGNAFFFEVNLRNDGTSHFFQQAGANIPLAWYYDAIGKSYAQVHTEVTEDCWYIDELFDVANVWNGTVGRKQWKKEKNEATIFKYYDAEDEQPWKSMKRNRLWKILQDTIIKKYRLYIVWMMDKLKH